MTDSSRTTQHVLVTTDFSDASESACQHALAVALRLRARLTFLHTGSESRDAVPWDRYPDARQMLVGWGMLEDGADKSVIAKRFGVDVAKRAIRDEDPRLGIIDFLRHRPADLLVMATECRDGVNRVVSPSIAESVGFESHSLTLLLPHAGSALIDRNGNWMLRRILCALDPQCDARTTIAFLGRWLAATRPPGGVIEVSVLVASGSQPPPGLAVLPDIDGIAWQRTGCETLSAESVIDAARAHDADLLMLGASNPRAIFNRLRGTDIDRICAALRKPVLMTPRN